MSRSSKPKNCKNCGLCCTWEVEIYPEDKDDIPKEMTERIKTSLEELRIMRLRPGTNVCIALDLKTKKCTIHNKKPTSCKEFEIGGHDCLLAREHDSIKIYNEIGTKNGRNS